MQTISVGLVGITGYAGMELARLLALHPTFRLTYACSRAEAGKRLGEYYPFLKGLPGSDVVIRQFDSDEASAFCSLLFLAVPAGTAMKMVPPLLENNVKVVDFSADFRLKDVAEYEQWYHLPHEASGYLKEAVYGLPERYAEQIKTARLVANPGCYPTSIILGLTPALEHGLCQLDNIIIDSKSGTTGAGRKAAVPTLFSEVSDSFRAYGPVSHRHTPEIEQELGMLAKQELTVQFTPHLVPMNRGILSTIYTTIRDPNCSFTDLYDCYAQAWKDAPWVRVLPQGKLPETRHVRGTMFCDIGLAMDPRTRRLIIFSCIDNLCRGAAGQAVANANLMTGQSLLTGLTLAPLV